MNNLKRLAVIATCALCVTSFTTGTAFAAEVTDEEVVSVAPIADGIDIAPEDQGLRSTSRTYSTTEFVSGVYLKGAPFTMDSKGYAKFTSANQLAVDSSKKADVSYQILDNYSNEVISGTRKTGNATGATIDVSSKVQAGKEVKAYLKNNAATATNASGTFNW